MDLNTVLWRVPARRMKAARQHVVPLTPGMVALLRAHCVGSEAERAYRRAAMVERRRAMLATWGTFLAGEAAGGMVVPMRGMKA